MNAVSSDAFRDAMRRLTAAVSVITCVHDGKHYGMTATAVTSVCADPPALLVCVNESSALYQPLMASGHFCVNILKVGQENISAAFGGQLKGDERYSEGSWVASEHGPNHLADAQASIFCRTEKVVPFGTHGIFIGVVHAASLAETITSLLYENGRYVRSSDLAAGLGAR